MEPFHEAVVDLIVTGAGIGSSEVLPHQVESRVEEIERCLKGFGDLGGCGHWRLRVPMSGRAGPVSLWRPQRQDAGFCAPSRL
jgi:hypothetical protein